MRRSFGLFILLALALAFGVGHAQESAPFPPEAPDILFGDAVDILDMRLSSTQFQQARPAMVSIPYRAVITNDGRVFPFPEQLASLVDDDWIESHQYFDNRVYFQIGEESHGGDVQVVSASEAALARVNSDIQQYTEPIQQVWMLDLTSGSYTRLRAIPEYADTYCGALPITESIGRDWFVIVGRNGQQHACRLTDGFMTPPLPEGFDQWQIASIRPAGHLLLFGHSLDGAENTATLFAFNFVTHAVHSIGETAAGTVRSIRQIGEDENSFLVSIGETDANNASTITARYQVDLSGLTIEPLAFTDGDYYDNPPRLQAWEEIETSEGIARQITVLDLLTHELYSYPFAPSCIADGPEDFPIFYCRVLTADGTQADIIRVNVVTGESTLIYTGEVEQIRGILTDDRYLWLLMDDSGAIDNLEPHAFRALVEGEPSMVLVDTASGEIVFDTPAFMGGIADTWMPYAISQGDDWIVIDAVAFLHIEGGEVTQYDTPEAIMGGGIGGWVIYYPDRPENDTRFFEPVRLYHWGTAQEIDLIEVNRRFYDLVSTTYLGDSIFEVTVGYQIQDWGELPPLYDLAIYTIRVEGLETG